MTAQCWNRATHEIDPWADTEPRPLRDGCPNCVDRVVVPWCGARGARSVSLVYQCPCGHQWWTTWAMLDDETPLPALMFDSAGMPFPQLRLILDLITRRVSGLVSVSGVGDTQTGGEQ